MKMERILNEKCEKVEGKEIEKVHEVEWTEEVHISEENNGKKNKEKTVIPSLKEQKIQLKLISTIKKCK